MSDRLERIQFWTQSWGRWCQWTRAAKKTTRKKSNWPGIKVPPPLEMHSVKWRKAQTKLYAGGY